MFESPVDQSFYYTEGAIPFDARCYVERPADLQLRQLIARGELGYVLTASQMGKTSLIFRAQAELDRQGIPNAYIDLHRFGAGRDVTLERWCRSFLRALARELNLDVEVTAWWEANNVFTPIDSLLTFIREVVYKQTNGRGVIFIDEIGTALSLSFGDAFLGGLRSLYQYGGGRQPAMVLIGMIPPDRLIRDRETARFNVGAQIPLGLLDFADAEVLLEGLPARDEALLRRVFFWTNGHPYLTQKICRAIAQNAAQEWNDDAVDDLVRGLLLADEALELDSNLAYVRDALTENPRKVELLQVYREILHNRRVKNLEQSPLHQDLRFCGLARPDNNGYLVLANPIYRHVFDEAWVRANTPFRWWRAVPRYAWLSVGIILLLLLLLAGALIRTVASEQEAERQRNVAFTRQLIAESTALMESRYDLALLLAVEAFNVSQTSETEAALRYGLTANPYLLTFLREHEARVNVVNFSPDGTTFASADDSGRIVLWDTADREPLPLTLEGHRAGVSALTFAGDSSFLVSGGCAEAVAEPAECPAGVVAIWDLASGDGLTSYFADPAGVGHNGAVRALALSDGDRYLASVGGSTLIVRQLPDGEIVQRIESDQGAVTAVAFSPTVPDRLVYGDEQGNIRVIDLADPSFDLEFTAQRDRIAGVVFSHSGDLLASGSRDGSIALWDTDSWEPAGPSFHAHADAVYDIEFDAAGRLLSAGADGRMKRWDLSGLAAGEVVEEMTLTGQGDVVGSFSVAETPDGPLLVSVGDNNTIVLWDLTGDPARGQWLVRGTGGVLGLDFSDDGSVLAAAGEDGTIRLWDARRREQIGEPLAGHDGGARRVAFQPAGRYLASAGRDRRVLLWDLAAGRSPLTLGEHEAYVRDIAFSPNGDVLASADDLGMMTLWNVAGAARIGEPIDAHDAEIFDIDFSPDGRLLASGSWDGTVRFWDVATRQPVGEPVATGLAEIWDVDFSPDGTLLAIAGSSVDVLLIDTATHATTGTLLTNQTTRINSLAFSPDGALLATGSADSTIAIWDVATRQTVGRPLGVHVDSVYALAFSPNGRLLASADLGGRIFLSVIAFDDPAQIACSVAARDLMPEERAQYIGQGVSLADGCRQPAAARGGNE